MNNTKVLTNESSYRVRGQGDTNFTPGQDISSEIRNREDPLTRQNLIINQGANSTQTSKHDREPKRNTNCIVRRIGTCNVSCFMEYSAKMLKITKLWQMNMELNILKQQVQFRLSCVGFNRMMSRSVKQRTLIGSYLIKNLKFVINSILMPKR